MAAFLSKKARSLMIAAISADLDRLSDRHAGASACVVVDVDLFGGSFAAILRIGTDHLGVCARGEAGSEQGKLGDLHDC